MSVFRAMSINGKILLRDYINATIGFEQLGSLTNKSPKMPHAYVRSSRQSIRLATCSRSSATRKVHKGVQLQVTAVR